MTPNLWVSFNINNLVRVKLTETGKRIVHDGGYNITTDENDRVEFQLWELMHIFGPHLFLGCVTPFETSSLEFNLTDKL